VTRAESADIPEISVVHDERFGDVGQGVLNVTVPEKRGRRYEIC
jgi:hypothetical protein